MHATTPDSSYLSLLHEQLQLAYAAKWKIVKSKTGISNTLSTIATVKESFLQEARMFQAFSQLNPDRVTISSFSGHPATHVDFGQANVARQLRYGARGTFTQTWTLGKFSSATIIACLIGQLLILHVCRLAIALQVFLRLPYPIWARFIIEFSQRSFLENAMTDSR